MDRNLHEMASAMYEAGSLSARRAWIEIAGWCAGLSSALVALRKESVDRNMVSMMARPQSIRRSPQGERG